MSRYIHDIGNTETGIAWVATDMCMHPDCHEQDVLNKLMTGHDNASPSEWMQNSLMPW